MQDVAGFGRIYRIVPKGKRLQVPALRFESMDDLIKAFQCPAINVRYQALEVLKAKGDISVEPVKQLLSGKNPYHRARALWLLSQLGPAGKMEVERKWDDKDPLMRVVAFRSLRQTESNILPYAAKLSVDASLKSASIYPRNCDRAPPRLSA